MRWWILLSLLPALLAPACAPDETPEIAENALPRVTAELNDGDPLDNGATIVATISDADGELCSLEVEFSFDEGLTYEPATIPQHTAGNFAEVSCPDVGEKITLVWDLETDRGASTSHTAMLRFLPRDASDAGPPAHLLIDLSTEAASKVSGGFVERHGAQGTQWQYHATALAHVLVTADGAATTGEGLFGEDDFDSMDLQWSYDLASTPPEEHFQAMDWAGAQPGVGAFYLPVVYKDMDESGTWDESEELVGAAAQKMVAYIRPEGDWAHDDWYVIAFDAFAEPQLFLDFLPLDTPVDINLKGYSVFSGTLELVVTNAGDISSARRLGLMPVLVDPVVPPDYQEMTSTPFNPEVPTVTVPVHTDLLPADHREEIEWGAFATEVYVEALYLYLDQDGNSQADEGEAITHLATRADDGAYTYLVHLEGTMSWATLWDWAIDDCWSGFNLITPALVEENIYDNWICYPLEAPPDIGFVEF